MLRFDITKVALVTICFHKVDSLTKCNASQNTKSVLLIQIPLCWALPLIQKYEDEVVHKNEKLQEMYIENGTTQIYTCGSIDLFRYSRYNDRLFMKTKAYLLKLWDYNKPLQKLKVTKFQIVWKTTLVKIRLQSAVWVNRPMYGLLVLTYMLVCIWWQKTRLKMILKRFPCIKIAKSLPGNVIWHRQADYVFVKNNMSSGVLKCAEDTSFAVILSLDITLWDDR